MMQPEEEASVGLCARCKVASVQRSARGGRFWRCGRADTDAAYLRYPPLPVLRCPGFEEGGKLGSGGAGPGPKRPARERGER
jgi:hypothetical protein